MSRCFGVLGVRGALVVVVAIPETDSKSVLSFVFNLLSKYVGVRVGERNIAPGEVRASSSKVGKLVKRPPVGDFVGVFRYCCRAG